MNPMPTAQARTQFFVNLNFFKYNTSLEDNSENKSFLQRWTFPKAETLPRKVTRRDSFEIYLKKNENKIMISETSNTDTNFIINDISKELLSAVSLTLSNIALELIRNKHDIYITLQSSLLIGFVKGVITTASDILAKKNTSLSTIVHNCFFEIWGEISTELMLFFSGKKLSFTELNFFKSLSKSLFQDEVFKYIVKEASKTFISVFFFNELMSTFFNTILIITLSNILIEQLFVP